MATTWKECPDLMERLECSQNSPAHRHIDVTTFAAFCDTRDELARHVDNCEARVLAFDGRKIKQRKAA